jgi:F-type H+-transporting ATPase subunit b
VNAEKRVADMIDDARAKASEIVATGEKFKAETIDQAKVEANSERERIIAAAKAEAAQEYQLAREQLRNQVADLAVAGASKILQREIDPKAHADLLESIRREL